MDTIVFIAQNYPIYALIVGSIALQAVLWVINAVVSAIRIYSE